jgi:ADP-heptose:LPS heptosyltransferase
VAIDTEQFHYFSALMALLSRAPLRIGFKISPGRNLLYSHLVNYDLEGYEADQFMRLLGPLGITGPAMVEGCLKVDTGVLPPDVVRQLEAFGTATRLVVLHAGSTSRYKLWAAERVAELITSLGRDSALAFVLLGSGGEREVAESVLRQVRLENRTLSLTGDLTVAQSAAVIRRAALYVGGDSGLAHVALALGVPTVVWFGPSDSQKWGVSDQRHRIVRKPLACAPCFIFGYHKLCRTVACMDAIGVEDVLQSCRAILSDIAR